MIAVDTNILVYAHRVESEFHLKASAAIERLASANSAWAIPWSALHEFYRVVTDHRIVKTPTPIEIVFNQISAWLEAPLVKVIGETSGHFPTLVELASSGACRGARIHDARIAAICLCHGVSELWTADRDFSYFPKLKTRNPLVG